MSEPTTSNPPAVGFIREHDLIVVAVALFLLAVAWLWDQGAGAPQLKTFERDGMSLSIPVGWLVDPMSGPGATSLRGEDALLRLDLRLEDLPTMGVNVPAMLELDRGQRFGQLYEASETGRVSVAGREWLRTKYSYAFKPGATHAPRIATAVEYAFPPDVSVKADKLYVVTLQGTEERVKELEPTVLGSLTVTPGAIPARVPGPGPEPATAPASAPAPGGAQ